VILGALGAQAETRPEYGGTLHVMMRHAPTSLDPADTAQPDSFTRRNVTMLMFDTLVTIDENLQIRPALATAWQASSGSQRWQLRIRPGVKFHDGTVLTPEAAAASLRAANPTWRVRTDGDSLVIERDSSDPELLAQLAVPRNAIVKRNPDGVPSGTGPFRVSDWRPGRFLALAADENCWRGRPFLDAVEIEMGKNFHEQMTAMELGKADLAEVAVEQTHRLAQEGRRLATSRPMELIALQFSRDATSLEEKLLRESLALSIERGSIRNVLLQGAGESTGSILPTWMSGYGFVFSSDTDLKRARQIHDQAGKFLAWTVGYDGSDAVARLLAERIALNAKDAGLALRPMAATSADLMLVRIPLVSADPWVALVGVAMLAGEPAGREGGSVDDLYASERGLVTTQRIVPLFQLPVSYAVSPNLNNWALHPDGSWNLADAWLWAPNHEQ